MERAAGDKLVRWLLSNVSSVAQGSDNRYPKAESTVRVKDWPDKEFPLNCLWTLPLKSEQQPGTQKSVSSRADLSTGQVPEQPGLQRENLS